MDESWRMRMGSMPAIPPRRSAEHVSVIAATADSQALSSDDFSDVFGGPPRSILPCQFAGGRSNTSYEELFRPPEYGYGAGKSGRSLAAFRIPARNEGFYSDIFGSDDDGPQRRSRERSRQSSKAKSKSNSSSVLSSEELSPLRPVLGGDDVVLSSFASKLRPLNVPCRWNSTTMMPTTKEHSNNQGTSAQQYCTGLSSADYQVMENLNLYDQHYRSSQFGSTRKVLSPETISPEPSSYRSVKLSVVDDPELNSPSSAVSSLCQEHETNCGRQDRVSPEKVLGDVEGEEDEAMSSYVIEITSDHREDSCEAIGIEEAIAWAKEKFQFQTHSNSEKEEDTEQQQSSEMDQGRPNVVEYDEVHEMTQSPQTGTADLLDEDIRLWSDGRESNIRLLLSTLHHILWPDSGWYEIPLTSLIESSQVKKSYQKARLCLHPDKLQQRGATPAQKYLADKASSILQDAWTLFISQDVYIM